VTRASWRVKKIKKKFSQQQKNNSLKKMGKNVFGGEFFTIEGNNQTSHVSMIENRLRQKKVFV
jgi:hypothetical protein